MGAAVPPGVAHAICVSLPTWKDNVGYMEGEERVLDAIASGYPRFTIHFSVKKVRSGSSPELRTQFLTIPSSRGYVNKSLVQATNGAFCILRNELQTTAALFS